METRFLRIRTNGYDFIALGVETGPNTYLIGFTFNTHVDLGEIEDCSSWAPFELYRTIDVRNEIVVESTACDCSYLNDIYGRDLADAYLKNLAGLNMIYTDDESGFNEFATNQTTDDLDDIRDSWYQLDTGVDGYRVDWWDC